MQVDFNRGRWSQNTRDAYGNAWSDWSKYCQMVGAEALPALPQTIADFLYARAATHSTSTLSTRLAAIVAVHQLYDHVVNVKGSIIKDAWSDIRRTKGTRSTPKDALAAADMRKILNGVPGHLLLHRAVLLVGFASGMRRSEIVALDVADLTITPADMTVMIRRSKTDKSGRGEEIAILRSPSDYCAVRALEAWLGYAGIRSGPIFQCHGKRMDARTVADIVKRWAGAVGYDPRKLGGHSLRRGCVTEMFESGVSVKDVMAHSRHKTVNIALGYVQAKTALKNPAIKALQL